MCVINLYNLLIFLCLFFLPVRSIYSVDVNDITNIAFEKPLDGVLAAFGDFNSDELTDAFMIINSTVINVFLAHDKEPFLRPSSFMCNFTDFSITSVVPGDYDGDAYMDILITSQNHTENKINPNIHDIRILWGGLTYLNCSDALVIKATTYGHPLTIDYNRDMTVDLFGENPKRERIFLIFNSSRSYPIEKKMDLLMRNEIKIPHSHSFIDYNDDDAADLLITTKFNVEVWLNNGSGFTYDKIIEFPLGKQPILLGQVSFLDVALSGEFFLIMPVCFDKYCINSTIYIYDNNMWYNLEIDLIDGRGESWRFVPPSDGEIYLDTITMRSGDYNMDGYPDLLMTFCPINANTTQVFLLHNVPCKSMSCQFHRTFEVQWDKFTKFGNNVVMATFFDFYMDGVLDIIHVNKNQSTSTGYSLHAFKNELEYDTNFIKVIVVTGLTNSKIPITNRTLYSQEVTFGTNLPGPKIGYNTWSQEGNYRTGVCAQLPQSAYFALQLPYSIFGLDRTPNFVDILKVGLMGYSKSWSQIIPNSQIVVIPAPPDDPSQWTARLFVTPSNLILTSVLVLTALLVIIIGGVLYLHWKEKKECDEFDVDDSRYLKL